MIRQVIKVIAHNNKEKHVVQKLSEAVQLSCPR